MHKVSQFRLILNPSSGKKVTRKVDIVRRCMASWTVGLSPFFFKGSCEVLPTELTKLPESLFAGEEIHGGWCESAISLVYKNWKNLMWKPQSTASKLLAGIILHPLSDTLKRCIREKLAGFLSISELCWPNFHILVDLRIYTLNPLTHNSYLSWFENCFWLSRSCNSVTFPLTTRCMTWTHFTHRIGGS